jgi:triphosphatase
MGGPDHLAYAARSAAVEMVPRLSGELALQRAGYACIEHLARNEQAARTGEAEGIHQIRVAVRRWRATLSAFGPLVPQKPRRSASNELRWIADAFSEARNLDVFVSVVLAPARAALPWSSELERLAMAIDRRRRKAHAAAQTAIGSARYDASVRSLANWLDGCEWRSDGDPAALLRPIGELAPLLLNRRHRQVLKRAASFVKQSEEERHRLRITLKKLRYAAELVGDLYEPVATKEFIRSLKQLQDDLGDINDVSVARDMLASLADPALPNIGIDHAGRRIIAWHTRRLAGNEPMLRKRVRHLRKMEPFWMRPLLSDASN